MIRTRILAGLGGLLMLLLVIGGSAANVGLLRAPSSIPAPGAPVTPVATNHTAAAEPSAEPGSDTGETAANEPGSGEVGTEAEEAGNEGEEIAARDAWFVDQRVHGRKSIPANAMRTARVQAKKLRTRAAVATDPLRWSEVGPQPLAGGVAWSWGGSTPYSGRVAAIATDPNAPDTVYIGAALGGVWKSTNAGGTWTPVFDSVPVSVGPSLAIGAIAVDPNNSNIVWVGTGEANYSAGGYFGSGLYRSADGGGHWAMVGGTTFDQCSFSSIIVKPGDSNQVALGVTSGNGRYTTQCSAQGRAGVYRTTTGGTTWVKVVTGDATKVVLAPNSPTTLYAGIWGGGVYRSADFGGGWTKLTTLPVPAGFRRVEIAVAAAGSLSTAQTVYAAVGTSDNEVPAVYRSNDSGATWGAALATRGATIDGETITACNTQCSYDLALAVDPANPARAYLGATVFNIFNNGASYLSGVATPGTAGCPSYASNATVATSCIHADYHALTFDTRRRLWVGTDGGVYRSDDGGLTFFNLNNGLNNFQFYPGISGTLGTQLFAGAQDNGTSRFANSRSASLTGYGDGAASAVVGNGRAIESWQYLRIRKVDNGTICQAEDSYGLPDAGSKTAAPFIAPITGSPANASIVFAGSSAIWRTTNASSACGQTVWTQVSQRFGEWVHAISAAKDGVLVYAGTDSGHVFVGTSSASWATGFTTWAPRSTGLPNRTITDIWVNPADSSKALITVSGFGTGHLFSTTDAGVTWSNTSGNLPNSPTNAVAVDQRQSPVVIYVGTDVGVFWTTDGGTTWQNTSIGLPPTIVHDLLLDTTADRLVAATFGRGIWKAVPIGSGPAGPANDAFATAATATALPYTLTGVDTSQATTETGENVDPDCGDFVGKTVWYRFTPSASMTVRADTAGSTYDTILRAYRGTSLGGLIQVGCDDDGIAQGGASAIPSLSLAAGQTYYFQVGGWKQLATDTAVSGTAAFNLVASAPANDAFAAATAVGTLPLSVSGIDTAQATTEAGEDVDPSCSDFVGKTLWYKLTPTASMTITADTAGSSSGFDTVLALFQGTTLGGLTEIACDDDSAVAPATGGASRVSSINLTGGQTYYLQVGGWTQTLGGAASSGTLSVNVKVAGLANDAFSAATTVATGSLPFSATGVDTSAATTEQGEDVDPSCTDFVGKTLWYKLTPAASMTITADTVGSSAAYDTVLTLFQGSTLGGLTEIACDDDSAVAPATGGSSRIASVNLTAGQTYYLQVGGWKGATGTASSGTLSVRVASIDAFAGAGQPASLPFSATGIDTSTATTQANENLDPTCSDFVGKTVWFAYTPASNTTVTASTAGSTYDTVLVLYQGTTLSGLTPIACDDDSIAVSGPSRITSAALTGGQTYYFQVGGWTQTLGGTAASGTLSFSLTTP